MDNSFDICEYLEEREKGMKYRIVIRDEKGREYIIHAENKEDLEQRMEYLNKAYAASLNDYTLGLISLNLEGTMFLKAEAIYSIEVQEIKGYKLKFDKDVNKRI